MVKRIYIAGICLCLLAACSTDSTQQASQSGNDAVATDQIDSKPTSPSRVPGINYDALAEKIIYGQARLHDVKQALTDKDTGRLTNVMHGLYSMRWHRGVYKLIFELWELQKQPYPEFSWNLIENPPVRIALASTINRILITDTEEYLEYIREHKMDEHEFHRAQVVIALGLNGDPIDVPYLQSMADGDNHYVIQTAVTSLGLMNNPQASNALIELYKKYKDDPRGVLILEVLEKAYKLVPQTVSNQ